VVVLLDVPSPEADRLALRGRVALVAVGIFILRTTLLRWACGMIDFEEKYLTEMTSVNFRFNRNLAKFRLQISVIVGALTEI